MRTHLFLITGLFLSMMYASYRNEASASDRMLTLQESISIALDQSTAVRAADHGVSGADADRKAARTDFLPRIGTAYSYTRFDEDPFMRAPAGDFAPYPIEYKISKKNLYQWNTYLTQPLFTGGALVSSYQMAKLGVDIAHKGLDRARQDTVVAVKEAYFHILKAEKLKAVALQAVEQVQSHVAVAQAFYEEEMIPRNDLLEAEVRSAQVQQDLIRAENSVAIAQAHFNTVLRRDVNEPAALEDIIAYQPEFFSLENCRKEALEKRPEMKEATLRLAQSQKGVTLAKSSYFPSVSVVANYQKMGDSGSLNGSPYEDDEMWTVGAVCSWDIWEWGKRSYQVSSRKALAAQAEEGHKQTGDIIALEVKQAFLNLQESEKNIFVARTAITQAEENFRLNKELYNEQMATTTEVLDAQTLLTQAQNNYYNALNDYHIAKARLERAMGNET
jgi:outer membrane protein TolC